MNRFTVSTVMLMAIAGAAVAPKGVKIAPSVSSKPVHESTADTLVKAKPQDDGASAARIAVCKTLRRVQQDSDDWCIQSNPDLHVLIAMVPDPAQTNLPLQFDRSIDSLQQAAAESESNYILDRYWLPWSTSPSPAFMRRTDVLAEEKERRDRTVFPGIMVLRGRSPAFPNQRCSDNCDRYLIIFLVAESPTSGINSGQFYFALRWASELRTLSGDGTSKAWQFIVGPNFSGSLFSLRRILTTAPGIPVTAEAPFGAISDRFWSESISKTRFYFASPSVTDGAALQTFEQEFNDRTPAPSVRPLSVWFQSFTPTDPAILGSFHDFLNVKGPVERPRWAILSEDDTQYGEANIESVSILPNVLQLHYPREISHLRVASSDLFTSTPESPVQDQRPQSPALPFKIGGAEHDQSTVPSFDPSHTSLSQELIMRALLERLREERVRLLIIRATDPLDQVFLQIYLRRSAPNVRLLLLQPDLLNLRVQEQAPALGTLYASPYPLSHETLLPDVSGAATHQSPFPAATSEATHYAADAALQAMRASAENCKNVQDLQECVKSYLTSAANKRRWLTVQGYSSFWPILSDVSSEADKKTATRTDVPFAWLCLCISSSLLGGYVAAARVGACKTRSPWCCYLRTEADPQLSKHNVQFAVFAFHRFYVFCVLWMCSCCLLLLLLTTIAHGRFFHWVPNTVFAVIALSLSYVFSSGVLILKSPASPNIWERLGRLFMISISSLLLVLWCTALLKTKSAVGPFMTYRAVHLESGVSPFLPNFFLMLGWIALAFVQVTATYQDIYRRPNIERIFSDLTDHEARLRLKAWAFPRRLCAFSAITFVPLLGLFLSNSSLATFDLARFTWLFSLNMLIFAFLVHFFLIAAVSLWRTTRTMLQRIDNDSIADAMSQLPKDFTKVAVWDSGAFKSDWTGPRLAARTLHDLLAVPGSIQQTVAATRYGTLLDCVLADELRSRAITAEQQLEARQLGDSLSNEFRNALLSLPSGSWRATLMRRFLAIRTVLFVKYAMVEVRNRFLFVMLGFVMGLFALNSYPFQGHLTLKYVATAVLITYGVIIAAVFAQIERDPLLSKLEHTDPGELNKEYYLRLLNYAAAPVLAFVATQFPQVSTVAFSWLEPTLKNIH